MTASEDGGWGADPGWRSAEHGLRWCFRAMVAFCIYLGGAVLVAAVAVSVLASEPGSAGDAMAGIQIYSMLGWLVVLAVMVPGLAAWRRLPKFTTARGLADASLWLTLLYIAITAVSFALAAPHFGDVEAAKSTSGLQVAAGVVGNLAMAAAIITFQLSLVRAAARVGRADIAAIARRALIVSIIVLLSGLIIMLVAQAMAGTDLDLMGARGSLAVIGLLGLVAMGLGVWALVDVMRTLSKLRAAILHEVSIVAEF